MTVTIRPATEDDIDAIYALSCTVHLSPLYQQLIPKTHRAEFNERFTPTNARRASYHERLQRHLANPDWLIWVAEDKNGTICGFTAARQLETILKLKGLFVSEAFQGQGIGRRLFDASCEAVTSGQPIVLDVIAKNKRAIEFYLRAGFHQIPDTPEPFYGAPMIRMQKY